MIESVFQELAELFVPGTVTEPTCFYENLVGELQTGDEGFYDWSNTIKQPRCTAGFSALLW